jgi:hypothetical protein
MINAICKWEQEIEGIDVLVTINDNVIIFDEKPMTEGYKYGLVRKGTMYLTADESLVFASELIKAANQAKELDSIHKDVDKMQKVPKLVGYTLSKKDLEELLVDHPLDTLTCYNCPNRGTCKYVDDLYNINGDCLAIK